MKVRARIGLRLTWPIKNAATFVFYASEARFSEIFNAVQTLKGLLGATGDAEATNIADRLFCERA